MARFNYFPADQEMVTSSVLSRPAEEFGNDATIESMWASKAIAHAEVFTNIICSVDPKLLRLTPHDELIYKTFREYFPNLDVAVINENKLKSQASKNKWRPFCEHFKDIVDDYNFGTMLRADCRRTYTEENTILTPRIQFYAIEIARNREGLNDDLKRTYRP